METNQESMVIRTEEQRPGNNRATKIIRSYIAGAQYRRKFDEISDSPVLNRLLYRLAKRMLYHRSGTVFEDMYWISPETLGVVAAETASSEEKSIHYSRSTLRLVKQTEGLITIHSHPDSYPPSIEDFNSNFFNHYSMGIVVGHNGAVYQYASNQEIKRMYYELCVAGCIKEGLSEHDAQLKTLRELSSRFSILFKEVTV